MATDFGSVSFFEIFRAEARAINQRRRAVATGKLAEDRGHKWDPDHDDDDLHIVDIVPSPPSSHPNEPATRPKPADGHRLVGLALSGGGVRSAAFCLGALQGLDSVRPNEEPQLLDRVDYISAVSGGGYMASSLVWGMTESNARFPFASKLDTEETIDTKQLRDHSNYLMPTGFVDVLIGLLAVARGLAVNAMILLSIILVLAGITLLVNQTRPKLLQPAILSLITDSLHGYVFLWSMLVGGCLIAYAVLDTMGTARRSFSPSLERREMTNRRYLKLASIWFLLFAFEGQAYVLSGIFAATNSPVLTPDPDNAVAGLLFGIRGMLAKGWWAALAAAAGLVASVSKLTAIVKTTLGDRSWAGSLQRWVSLAAVYLAAAVAPLMIWLVYLSFSYWGIADPVVLYVGAGDAAQSHAGYGHTPAWLRTLAFDQSPLGYSSLYLVVGLFLFALSLFVRPNTGSLHGYYRDRLSRAFLWDTQQLQEAATKKIKITQDSRADKAKFSELKPYQLDRYGNPIWDQKVRFAPYIICNAAVNLGGSVDLNRRGRNADNFIFSPLYIGSEATRYVSADALEACDPDINLATAMAASGAAASANMGASTIRALTFTLSAFNVRLGYWIPNPKEIVNWCRSNSNGSPAVQIEAPRRARIGLLYFAAEALGLIDETSDNVYLTDGGHYDNLGLYELLKRSCSLIICFDAEADPTMNFDSLVRLQRYARIDLGVTIELPWGALKAHSLQVTADQTRGPPDSAFRRDGPHVAIGRIQYSKSESGVLIYVKASMSGDESDLLRDYKRRNADFPHETTVDQFFSEEQFEVYRALGFHILSRFLDGEDNVATLSERETPGWLDTVRQSLELINVRDGAIDQIIARAGGTTPTRKTHAPKPKAMS